jgi:phytanoyl-CoA dioxygenase PhyH
MFHEIPHLSREELNNDIGQRGFAVVSNVLSDSEVARLLDTLGSVSGPGRRGLLDVPAVAALARSEKLLELVGPHMSGAPRAVRMIYFDKSADANWLVAWHQDLTVAVQERVDVPGFGPWSVKAGVPHVQAPVELLEQMLTLRIHLDDCDETNGALRVLPGTHRLGRLSSERIQALRTEREEVVCRASAGDVMLMRPLLLHSSGKSKGNGHRRVLHIEYAGFELPGELRFIQGGR